MQHATMQHLGEEQLFSYIDNELSPAERRDVAVHLATCSACAAQLTEWKAVLGDVEALPEVALAVDLSERVVETLSAETNLITTPAVRWLAIVEAIIVAGVLAVGWPFARSTVAGWQAGIGTALNSADGTWTEMIAPIANSIANGQASLSNLPTLSLSLTLSLTLLALVLIIWLASTRLALHNLDTQL